MTTTEPTQPPGGGDPATTYGQDARAVLAVHDTFGYPGLTQVEVADRQLARAAVSATLAVAEEQRTANLIAYVAVSTQVATTKAPLSPELNAIALTVRARLGL